MLDKGRAERWGRGAAAAGAWGGGAGSMAAAHIPGVPLQPGTPLAAAFVYAMPSVFLLTPIPEQAGALV